MTRLSEQQLRGLWQQLKADQDVVLLDGFHSLKHALRFSAQVPLAVAVDKRAALALASSLADDIVDLLDETLVEVSRAFYRDMLPKVHPTEVASFARKPSPDIINSLYQEEQRQSPVIVLDNPRNLGNVGAVIRLAAGLGASGVITTGDTDPWHPQVIRGSAGLHFAIPVHRIEEDRFPPGPLYALDPEGVDIRTLTFPSNALLAFGSERHGISPAMRARADMLIAIPMRPKVSSYNLATSVAMALFHWLSRQHHD